MRAPAAIKIIPELKVSGQGFWKFIAARDRVLVPAGVPAVKQAHAPSSWIKRQTWFYWGLQGVGWVGFSNQLRASWIVAGNPAFTNGNLHGADILPQGKKSPRIAAADNMSGKIYLTDTGFQNVETLSKPDFGTYATNNTFKPTDVAFTSAKELWVVDGYGNSASCPQMSVRSGGRASITVAGRDFP